MSIGVERRLTLAPAPDSARTARRLVADVLASAHAEHFTDSATLLTFDEIDDGGAPLAARALAALADAAAGLFPARDSGATTADIDLELPSEAVPWFPILRDVLARATVMAVAGKLLTPPSLPEITAVRRWVCDEIARQSARLFPTPWAEQAIDHPMPAPASETLLDEVRRSALPQVGADAANRIAAVSRAAAELLGWSAEELEGKRLVTIIPARFRDRHIAGFSRYLLEGTSRMIGQPADVPALRKDGSEIDIELLIERRPDRDTRGLFVATLTPR